jgi:hypothetical protein
MRPPAPRHPDPSAAGPTRPEDTRLSSGAGDLRRLALASQQRRRAAYRAGPLQVWWDGRARRRVGPGGGPFRVPLSVAGLDIVGKDADGTLLLAVVPLPSPGDVAPGGAQHRTVTLEGGQTLALTIARATKSRGRRGAYVIQLTYTDPPAAEPPSPAVDQLLTQVTALGAEVDRLQARAVQFAADLDRLRTHALTLVADLDRLQGRALARHRDQVPLRALRARVKDALQQLLQLSAETPWVCRDGGDQEGPDPEALPPEGPS